MRRPRDLYCDALFRELAGKRAGFRYLPVISAAQPGDDWPGAAGFVHEAAERLFAGRFDGWQAYLCGPPPMIEACIATLMRGRLFERSIHTESFITAAEAPAVRSPLARRL